LFIIDFQFVICTQTSNHKNAAYRKEELKTAQNTSLLLFPLFEMSLILVVAHPGFPGTFVTVGPLEFLAVHFLAEAKPVIIVPEPAAAAHRGYKSGGYNNESFHSALFQPYPCPLSISISSSLQSSRVKRWFSQKGSLPEIYFHRSITL